jgi:hypothetical protein
MAPLKSRLSGRIVVRDMYRRALLALTCGYENKSFTKHNIGYYLGFA